MLKHNSAKLTKVSVTLPFGIGSAEWEPDSTERRAAWSLYIELVTRIAVQPLDSEEGLLRESITSLYSLFGTTREVLKSAGPDVGISHKSVGGIAIAVLNNGLRPFLAKWHPMLQVWESQRSASTSPKEHEISWIKHEDFRDELSLLREDLSRYAYALEKIAGITE